MNTENTSLTEGTVKYDILFYAYAPVLNETVKLIINVEAQNLFNPGYSLLKRAVYYCSRLISSQYNTEFEDKSYDGIKKVFSIWICTNPPVDKRNTITRFSFNQENLIGKAEFNTMDYDLIEFIMVCLGGKSGDENYNGLIKLLDTLLSSELRANEKRNILEKEYNVKMTKKIEREVLGMCNISDGIVDKAINKGIAQGIAQDITKGITETRIDSIKSIMTNLSLTFEQALKALNIPEEEYSKYREILEQ